MQLTPLADRLVLKRVEATQKTKTGIVLPDTAKEKPEEGQVVAAGKEVKEVKKGDRVLFSKYAPTEVKVEGVEYLIVKEEDVLAVIR